MARLTALLLLALLAFAGVANAARGLKQDGIFDDVDDDAGDDDGTVSTDSITFTLTINPKLNIEPGLDVTALDLAPGASASLTTLALALQEVLGFTGVFSPGFTNSTSTSRALPATSTTIVESAAGPVANRFMNALRARGVNAGNGALINALRG
ncbi:MAG: hypothetical protein J3K34DRAFT_525492 [Monoraphidium minutum]|nr:MAG: hypothetical protein J3K34DRAFT_525492 [Monoraphidium minutum]